MSGEKGVWGTRKGERLVRRGRMRRGNWKMGGVWAGERELDERKVDLGMKEAYKQEATMR